MNRSLPETGCCSWEREPGSDDDDWQPVGFKSQQQQSAELWQLTHRGDASDGASI